MLLLYRYHRTKWNFQKPIYIPLCFYFIYTMLYQFLFETTYLHSIMLLLYQLRADTNMTLTDKFTFHYASTLSRYHRWIRWSVPDLHSIMLLLYQWFPVTSSYIVIIYIPLCFYFIWLASPCSTGWFQIYIPLCFYFIMPEPLWFFVVILIYIPLCFYFIGQRL